MIGRVTNVQGSGIVFLNFFQLAFIYFNLRHTVELWGVSWVAYWCLASVLICTVSLSYQLYLQIRTNNFMHS